MGAGLAWAWTLYPYTSLVLVSNTNDVLVPLFLVYALLFMRSPPARGALSALATMTKFAPGIVAPLFLVGRGPLRIKSLLIAGAVYAAVCVGLIWLFLPEGGLKEFWNTTIGFQIHRTSPLAIWTRAPSLDFLRPIAEAAAVGLAIVAAFVPRRRTTGQVAALCAAILASSQIPANYWLYFYTVWFAPFVFVALFEEYRDLGTPSGERDERLGEAGEDVAAVVGDGDKVLDPHPQHAG